MFYHPAAYLIGIRDVIAAWLICLAVAAVGAASVVAISAREEAASAALDAPYRQSGAGRTAICATVKSAPAAHRV